MGQGRPSQIGLVFERQWLHAALLALLVAVVAWVSRSGRVQVGELAGIATPEWLWLAVAIAVAHQGLVWFCWRTELHLSLLSRLLGRHGFTLYAVLFSLIGIARVAAVFALGMANRNTLALNPWLLKLLAVVALVPAVYLFYSVGRYFGFRRAFGIDHFDTSYRALPLVREGIFRWTPNAMYTFGFLLLWVPGLWFASAAGLCAAAFNHAYIWVHYWATERPDMRRIYGAKGSGEVEGLDRECWRERGGDSAGR